MFNLIASIKRAGNVFILAIYDNKKVYFTGDYKTFNGAAKARGIILRKLENGGMQ